MKGWIKLHRDILDWEWYEDANMVRIFIHILVCANSSEGQFKGVKIMRGQWATGRKSINRDLSISEQTIRTSLKKLVKTGEITIKSTRSFSIITICNYEHYQWNPKTDQPTDQPEVNHQLTIDQPATNHKQEPKKKEVKKKSISIPTVEEFLEYGIEKKPDVNQVQLKMKYEAWVENGWKDGNEKPVKNWKTKLLNTLPYLKTESDGKPGDRMARIAKF